MQNKKKKAKALYLQGKRPKEIAGQLDISDGTVRSWISRERWKDIAASANKDRKPVATSKNTLQRKTKTVATKNNRGSPLDIEDKHNRLPAVKHGAYKTIMYSTMTEEELELISGPCVDEIEELEREKDILTVRELKYLKLIKSIKDCDGDLITIGIDKKVRNTIQKGDINFTEEEKEIAEKSVYSFELINKYESELTRIQKQRTKVIETIAKIKNERSAIELAYARLELDKFKIYGTADEDEQDTAIKSFLTATQNSFNKIGDKLFDDFNSDEYGIVEIEPNAITDVTEGDKEV